MEDREPLAVDPLESIFLNIPDKTTYVSSLLSSGEKKQIQQVLLRNMDVFAWTHLDMAGINPVHASYKPNVISSARPVRQKVRCFHQDRHQVIQAEASNKTLLITLKKRLYSAKRQVGRRTPQGTLGLQNESPQTNQYIPLRAHLWDGSYSPNKNRYAHTPN